jgi:hypothetical protein
MRDMNDHSPAWENHFNKKCDHVSVLTSELNADPHTCHWLSRVVVILNFMHNIFVLRETSSKKGNHQLNIR